MEDKIMGTKAKVEKAEKLIRYHRQNVFIGTEASQDRHTRAIRRIKKIIEPLWWGQHSTTGAYDNVLD
jgi:hypothetical protein